MEVLPLQPGSILHADQRIGVAWIAHYQHLTVLARYLIQCNSLKSAEISPATSFSSSHRQVQQASKNAHVRLSMHFSW